MKLSLTRPSKAWTCLTLGIVGLLAIPQQSYALFGVGDVVFDPTNYVAIGHIWSQDISNYAKLVETVESLGKIYAAGMNVYTLGLQMSRSLSTKAGWMTVATRAQMEVAGNRYGEMAAWEQGLNGHPEMISAAYRNSTLQLSSNVNLSNETLGSSAHLANLASIEGMDAANIGCLQSVAQTRQNMLNNILPIGSLQTSLRGLGVDVNTNIAQLNQVNGLLHQLHGEAQTASTLQSCMAEQQMLQMTMQRNLQVSQLNNYAAMDQSLQSNPQMPVSMSGFFNAQLQ